MINRTLLLLLFSYAAWGQIDTVNMVNGNDKKMGYWIDTLINDGEVLKSISYYEDGIIMGESRNYYDNGNIEGIFNFNKKGNQDGVMKIFYKSGILKFVFIVEDGKNEYSVQYMPNGKIFQEHYGGKYFMYDENGKCIGGDCKELTK